ncbi:hypothetical protein PO124_19585 [Bacillus licheniformis]|nr:hypothetical protein [Bacillus licheniformis]
MKVNGLKAQDRLNDAGFAIKNNSPKRRRFERYCPRCGSRSRRHPRPKGSNYSAHVNDAHKASKAKMQDSIQRVEKEIEAGKSVKVLLKR